MELTHPAQKSFYGRAYKRVKASKGFPTKIVPAILGFLKENGLTETANVFRVEITKFASTEQINAKVSKKQLQVLVSIAEDTLKEVIPKEERPAEVSDLRKSVSSYPPPHLDAFIQQGQQNQQQFSSSSKKWTPPSTFPEEHIPIASNNLPAASITYADESPEVVDLTHEDQQSSTLPAQSSHSAHDSRHRTDRSSSNENNSERRGRGNAQNTFSPAPSAPSAPERETRHTAEKSSPVAFSDDNHPGRREERRSRSNFSSFPPPAPAAVAPDNTPTVAPAPQDAIYTPAPEAAPYTAQVNAFLQLRSHIKSHAERLATATAAVSQLDPAKIIVTAAVQQLRNNAANLGWTLPAQQPTLPVPPPPPPPQQTLPASAQGGFAGASVACDPSRQDYHSDSDRRSRNNRNVPSGAATFDRDSNRRDSSGDARRFSEGRDTQRGPPHERHREGGDGRRDDSQQNRNFPAAGDTQSTDLISSRSNPTEQRDSRNRNTGSGFTQERERASSPERRRSRQESDRAGPDSFRDDTRGAGRNRDQPPPRRETDRRSSPPRSGVSRFPDRDTGREFRDEPRSEPSRERADGRDARVRGSSRDGDARRRDDRSEISSNREEDPRDYQRDRDVRSSEGGGRYSPSEASRQDAMDVDQYPTLQDEKRGTAEVENNFERFTRDRSPDSNSNRPPLAVHQQSDLPNSEISETERQQSGEDHAVVPPVAEVPHYIPSENEGGSSVAIAVDQEEVKGSNVDVDRIEIPHAVSVGVEAEPDLTREEESLPSKSAVDSVHSDFEEDRDHDDILAEIDFEDDDYDEEAAQPSDDVTAPAEAVVPTDRREAKKETPNRDRDRGRRAAPQRAREESRGSNNRNRPGNDGDRRSNDRDYRGDRNSKRESSSRQDPRVGAQRRRPEDNRDQRPRDSERNRGPTSNGGRGDAVGRPLRRSPSPGRGAAPPPRRNPSPRDTRRSPRRGPHASPTPRSQERIERGPKQAGRGGPPEREKIQDGADNGRPSQETKQDERRPSPERKNRSNITDAGPRPERRQNEFSHEHPVGGDDRRERASRSVERDKQRSQPRSRDSDSRRPSSQPREQPPLDPPQQASDTQMDGDRSGDASGDKRGAGWARSRVGERRFSRSREREVSSVTPPVESKVVDPEPVVEQKAKPVEKSKASVSDEEKKHIAKRMSRFTATVPADAPDRPNQNQKKSPAQKRSQNTNADPPLPAFAQSGFDLRNTLKKGGGDLRDELRKPASSGGGAGQQQQQSRSTAPASESKSLESKKRSAGNAFVPTGDAGATIIPADELISQQKKSRMKPIDSAAESGAVARPAVDKLAYESEIKELLKVSEASAELSLKRRSQNLSESAKRKADEQFQQILAGAGLPRDPPSKRPAQADPNPVSNAVSSPAPAPGPRPRFDRKLFESVP